jgi:hypothetical protein
MYRLINKHCDQIIAQLDRDRDVARYTQLRSQLLSGVIDVTTNISYQRLYRDYWSVQRRNPEFCRRYFHLLAKSLSSGQPDIEAIVRDLENASGDGKSSLEFSFATKIANMIDPRVPVYDSLIAAFFFYVKPDSTKSFDERLKSHQEFHAFLKDEYRRIIDAGLLTPSLEKFQFRFSALGPVCNERIVDWLIWTWASQLRGGARRVGTLLYD